MAEKYNENSKYINIFNRVQKRFSSYECLYISKQQYFIDNFYYYILCLIFRFIPLIILSGDYSTNSNSINVTKSIQEYLKLFTCHNLISILNFNYKMYIYIYTLLLLLFILRIIIDIYFIIRFQRYKYTQKWPLPCKYKIIIDHITFLFYPYIIEYLSFIYYIYLFPDSFIIKHNLSNKNHFSFFIHIFVSTILIIAYNIINYVDIICLNKRYIISIFDAYSNLNDNSNIKKSISFKVTNLTLYLIIFFQNFTIFLTIENYLKKKYKMNFKILVSILLVLTIFIFFFQKINKFNYPNTINSCINVMILYCFYSIIIDIIILIFKYRIENIIILVVYTFLKLFLSYMTYLLFSLKTQKYLEGKIREILFQEKNEKSQNILINCLYYFHQIILNIKEKNEIKLTLLLIEFLNPHIIACRKLVCNCKLLKPFMNKETILENNYDELKEYKSKLLLILNYLFECAFIESNYYDNYELATLLSEHFCHLKDNPTMAFSLIHTLIIKHKGKFSKFQMVNLYALLQKYIYFLSAKSKKEIEEYINENNNELLKNKVKIEKLRNCYSNLKNSYQVKKLLYKYINNRIKILKYKIIFHDSLSFIYDENNEYIISVIINFFEETVKIDGLFNESINNKIRKIFQKNEDNHTNLHFVTYLLKNEQFYYSQIINHIKHIQIKENTPIFIIFKYFIFFDIFEGGKIPDEIKDILINFLSGKTSLYNTYITTKEYSILSKIYNEQNNSINSKYYAIFEYKRELVTKYYNEACALKLGYLQKDIVNKRIDELMHDEFAGSHQNLIKQLLIGSQLKYAITERSFFFDKSKTILYAVNYESLMLYNISKYFNIIFQAIFKFENEYFFLLNQNFEILSISKNFEKEYFLNQNILKTYNIQILDILKIKMQKIKKAFKKELKSIQQQKFLRQAKTDEYFIPQFYVPVSNQSTGMMNPLYFNISKTNILSKLTNSNNIIEEIQNTSENESREEEEEFEEENEQKKFIQNKDIKKLITELFINKGEIVFHNAFDIVLNRGKFIENFAKELTKIQDYDLKYGDANDNINYNLIVSAKQLISNLYEKNEILNQFIKINFKLSFYYDKSFYFITINDENKFYLNLSKRMNFENQQINSTNTSSSLGNKIPVPYKSKNSRNKRFSIKKILSDNEEIYNSDNNKNANEINEQNEDEGINEIEKNDKEIVMNKINNYRNKINKDKFIFIIRIILTIIIISIIIIYIAIIEINNNINNTTRDILLTNFYNSHTKDYLLNIYSELIQIYYDYIKLAKNPINNDTDYENNLHHFSSMLNANFHNFTEYYFDYNIDLDQNFNLLYIKKNFSKIKEFWQEFNYSSNFYQELDFIIYNIYNIKLNQKGTAQSIADLNNYLFFRERRNTRERLYSSMIQILYYLSVNYEFVFKDVFNDIEEQVYSSFKQYINNYMYIYISLEVLGLLLFFIFYITVYVFLYYSNEIIIKNIIFLFLDFSEDIDDKKNINNLIISKLFQLQNLIDDFNIKRFKIFSHNIDNINKNKPISKNNSFNNFYYLNENESENNYESNFEEKYISINQTEKTMKKNKNTILESSIKFKDNRKSHKFSNKKINNSSQSNLVDSNNSQFFRDKLNNNIASSSNDFLSNNNNSKNLLNNKESSINSNTNSIAKNNEKEKEKQKQEDINNIILNKSKKSKIFIIKLYSYIIILFNLLTIFFSIYKFIFSLRFSINLNNFFIDFNVITNRNNLLFYYFNIFRTLLIFPEDKRKEKFEQIMEKMAENYNSQNTKYLKIISNNLGKYIEINKLFDIIKQTKEGSIEVIKTSICRDKTSCLKYLNSEYNIFDSGIDFAFQICIQGIDTFFAEYAKLKNKTDYKEINSTIINSFSSQFIHIGLSLNNIFYFVKEKIYESFKIDETNFRNNYNGKLTTLNLIYILLSVFISLFVNIFIFISLYKFIKPIKDSTYRINYSFYNISKYSLKINRKKNIN